MVRTEEGVPVQGSHSETFGVVSPVVFHVVGLESLDEVEVGLSPMMEVVVQDVIEVQAQREAS